MNEGVRTSVGSPPVEPEADTVPLDARGVEKVYPRGDGGELPVLQGVDLRVQEGEVVAVIGASGSGKSTLLHLLGGLDQPTRGEVRLNGHGLGGLDSGGLASLRNRYVGFVFQFHHLLREFTALENVSMPPLIAGVDPDDAQRRARDLLVDVGLGERLDHRPWELSGGEQQRVAVARALANEPLVLLADEPSGNLDARASDQLHELLFRVRGERAVSMVIVTHNRELAQRADRVLVLEDGTLKESEAP